jgi:hypothetical protein
MQTCRCSSARTGASRNCRRILSSIIAPLLIFAATKGRGPFKNCKVEGAGMRPLLRPHHTDEIGVWRQFKISKFGLDRTQFSRTILSSYCPTTCSRPCCTCSCLACGFVTRRWSASGRAPFAVPRPFCVGHPSASQFGWADQRLTGTYDVESIVNCGRH